MLPSGGYIDTHGCQRCTRARERGQAHTVAWSWVAGGCRGCTYPWFSLVCQAVRNIRCLAPAYAFGLRCDVAVEPLEICAAFGWRGVDFDVIFVPVTSMHRCG